MPNKPITAPQLKALLELLKGNLVTKFGDCSTQSSLTECGIDAFSQRVGELVRAGYPIARGKLKPKGVLIAAYCPSWVWLTCLPGACAFYQAHGCKLVCFTPDRAGRAK